MAEVKANLLILRCGRSAAIRDYHARFSHTKEGGSIAADVKKDPSRLFNSSLDGKVRRAIDLHEGDAVDEAALKDIRAAVALSIGVVVSQTRLP
jgi:hypothetical protein